jgi:short-chain fatty acids transporter
MIQRLGELFNRLARRFMPHPFVFALLLTFVTAALALTWAGAKPFDVVRHWQEGVFTPALLVFMVQMCLVLLTGHALASTRPVAALLARLASIPRGPRSAAALAALVAMTSALLNWALGLIVGALFAREVARRARARGIAIHYPLVVAAGYTGLMIWHGGFSGSAPLMVATPGHFLEKEMGVIPVTDTLLSPLNLATRCALLVAAPLLLALMAPRDAVRGPGEDAPGARADESGGRRDGSSDRMEEAESADGAGGARTIADRLEESRLLALLGAALAATFLALHFGSKGLGGLDLNSIILVFLGAGLALHGTPVRYARAIDEATPGASGILLQFPFYFGIMGIMKGAGLVALLAEGFVGISGSLARVGIPTEASYSVTTWLAAAVINNFVPSGGGQWAVQGPIAVEAAARLGVPMHKAVLAIAYGDEFTNMIQPFWTLPLLAIAGLKPREIIGYTALLMLLVTPIYVVALAFLR